MKKIEYKDDQVICDVCNEGTGEVTWCNLSNTQGYESDYMWVCNQCMKKNNYQLYGWSDPSKGDK